MAWVSKQVDFRKEGVYVWKWKSKEDPHPNSIPSGMRAEEIRTKFQLEQKGAGSIQNRFWRLKNFADNSPWVSKNTVRWF